MILSYLPNSFEKVHSIELHSIFIDEHISYWWAFIFMYWVYKFQATGNPWKTWKWCLVEMYKKLALIAVWKRL